MKRFVPEWLVRYVVLVGILIGGAALWWYWPEQPEPLLQAARRAPRGSLEAEDLATRSIVAARGDYPAAQFLLCQVLADRGRWSESALQFDKIQRPGQLGVEELCEFAEQAQQEQQSPYAAALLYAACLPNPQRQASARIPALRRLTQVEFSLQHYDRVRTCAEELTKLTPADPLPWKLLGAIAVTDKRHEDARAALEQCLSNSPPASEIPAIIADLVRTLLALGNLAEARERITPVLAQAPSTELRILNAYLLRLEGDRAAALETVDQLLSVRAPDLKIRVHHLRGMLLFDGQQWADAAEELEWVVARAPLNKEAHFQLAQAYQRLNRKADADKHRAISQRLTKLGEERLGLLDRLNTQPNDVAARERLQAIDKEIGSANPSVPTANEP